MIEWAKSVNVSAGLIEIRADIDTELNYDRLMEVSEHYGTTNISFTSEHESGGGGCDTCGFGGADSVHENVIYVRNATRNV